MLLRKIKSRTPKRQIMHQGGWGEEKGQTVLAPAEIISNPDTQDYYNTYTTQENPISSISVTGISKHSCHKHNFVSLAILSRFLQNPFQKIFKDLKKKSRFLPSSSLIGKTNLNFYFLDAWIFNFQTAFIYIYITFFFLFYFYS